MVGHYYPKRTRTSGNSSDRQKKQFAVENREEESAKRRNIKGTRCYGYIDRENEAPLAAIMVQNRASPNSGTLPIIFWGAVEIMCVIHLSPKISICGIYSRIRLGRISEQKHAREEMGEMIPGTVNSHPQLGVDTAPCQTVQGYPRLSGFLENRG